MKYIINCKTLDQSKYGTFETWKDNRVEVDKEYQKKLLINFVNKELDFDFTTTKNSKTLTIYSTPETLKLLKEHKIKKL